MGNGNKQNNGSNREIVEQQNAERHRKLKECADKVLKLQTEIEAADAISIQHGKRSLELVIEAGTLLIDAQDIIRYQDAQWIKKGLWAKWVSDNVQGITLRTVQNYMRVAAEAKHRDEMIRALGESQHVQLLSECKSIREAYRVVGVIKKKLGANKDGEGDPRELTVEQFKKQNPNEYAAVKERFAARTRKTVEGMIKDNKAVNWNLSEWKITTDGKPRSPNIETAQVLAGLLRSISDPFGSKMTGLTKYDVVHIWAGCVIAQILKCFIESNQSTPDTNRVDPVKQPKIEKLLRTINPFPLEAIPLEPMEPATPPVQTVQE